MKILAVSYLFPNSVYPNYGIFVCNRLKALQRYCEVKVINPIPWFPFLSKTSRYRRFNEIPEKETIDGLETYHPRFPIIPKYLKSVDAFSYSLAVLSVIHGALRQYDFDIIDLHWTYPDLPAGVLLKKLTGKDLITTVRGHEAFYIEEPGLRKNIVRYSLKKADAIIALSHKLENLAISQGIDVGRVEVVRNGVDVDRFQYMDRDDARCHLGLQKEEKIVLSVGSLIQGKGYDRIINSLPQLCSEFPNIKLYIIGSEGAAGFYRKSLEELVLKYDVQDSVIFVGEVDNSKLVCWYNAADVFCLASRREGSPNVLTEALSCGCPALATNVGSVSDIMENEQFGVIVNNEDDITDGLRKVLLNSYDRKEIHRHMSQYNWDWCAKRVLSIYTKVYGNE